MNCKLVCAAALMLFSFALSEVDAEPFFLDEFDQDVATFSDGRPVRWGSGAIGRVQEDSGSMVLTPTPGRPRYSGFVRVIHDDISLRTQFRMSDRSIANAGITARDQYSSGNWYTAMISPDGLLRVLRDINFEGTWLGEVELPDIDPVAEDINMQFDLFDDLLSVSVWPESDLKPSAAQLVVADNMIPDGGSVGIWMQGGTTNSSTAFRFFEAVPEPSSNLPMLGWFLLGVRLRRKRKQAA